MRRQRLLRRSKRPSPAGAPEAPGGPARYVNQFEVGYNAFEFLFDFSQDYDDGGGGGRGTAHTRIVTVPAYAKVFLGVLDRSIDEYEAQYGEITVQPDVPGHDGS